MTTDTYAAIRHARSGVWLGIWLMLGTGIAIATTRIVNSATGSVGEILGGIALGTALAVPAGLAWLSLDRRPGLLTGAAWAAILAGLISIVVLPIGLIVALLWLRSARRSRPGDPVRLAGLRRIGLAVLVVLAVVVLFVHADPVCSETLVDGTVRTVDPAEHGMTSGWRFSATSTTGSVVQQGGSDVIASVCDSDTIVLGEALASLVVSVGAIALAARWPVNRGSGGTDGDAQPPQPGAIGDRQAI